MTVPHRMAVRVRICGSVARCTVLALCCARRVWWHAVWWLLMGLAKTTPYWFIAEKASSSLLLSQAVKAKSLFLLQSIFQTEQLNHQRHPSGLKAAHDSAPLSLTSEFGLKPLFEDLELLQMAGNHLQSPGSHSPGTFNISGQETFGSPLISTSWFHPPSPPSSCSWRGKNWTVETNPEMKTAQSSKMSRGRTPPESADAELRALSTRHKVFSLLVEHHHFYAWTMTASLFWASLNETVRNTFSLVSPCRRLSSPTWPCMQTARNVRYLQASLFTYTFVLYTIFAGIFGGLVKEFIHYTSVKKEDKFI